MDFQKGVTVFIDQQVKIDRDRVLINNGSMNPDSREMDDVLYEKGAFIPKDNWRSLSDTESSMIMNNEKPKYPYESIQILKMDKACMSLFEKIGCLDVRVYHDWEQLSHHPKYNDTIEQSLHYINKYLMKGSFARPLGIGYSYPNVPGTTQYIQKSDAQKLNQYFVMLMTSARLI